MLWTQLGLVTVQLGLVTAQLGLVCVLDTMHTHTKFNLLFLFNQMKTEKEQEKERVQKTADSARESAGLESKPCVAWPQ